MEVGSDLDHIHFLVQSVPTYSVTELLRTIKSIMAREVFSLCPEVKQELCGGEFFGKGYYTITVGQHGTESKISNYIKNQGKEKEYKQLKTEKQIKIFL